MKEDVATIVRSRPNLAKVRVEVDLLKPLTKYVWVGHEGQRFSLKGHEQKLEYEGVPTFCRTCNLQGHDLLKCKVEARKINKNCVELGETSGQGNKKNQEENQGQQRNSKGEQGNTQIDEKGKKVANTDMQPNSNI